MTNSVAPLANAPHVLGFCARIVPSGRPVRLAIDAEPDCEPLDCFNNVRRKVDRVGGRIRFGWAIWEWQGVYIEAEHHCVYEPATEDRFSDITPSVDGETHRLFLPDSSATYDFANEGVRRDNHRHALTNDPLIHAFFRASEERSEIMNGIPGVGEVQVDYATAMRLHQLEQRRAELIFQIGMKFTGRNARCFCGSGGKFKRCHGRNA